MKIKWEFIGNKIKGAKLAPFIKSLIYSFSLTNSKNAIKGLPNGWVKINRLSFDTYKALVYQETSNYICAVFGKNTLDVKNRYYYKLYGNGKLTSVKYPDLLIFDNSEGGNGADIPIYTNGHVSKIIKSNSSSIFLIGDTAELELGVPDYAIEKSMFPPGFNPLMEDFYVERPDVVGGFLNRYAIVVAPYPISINTPYGNVFYTVPINPGGTFGNILIGTPLGYFVSYYGSDLLQAYKKIIFKYKNKIIEKELPLKISIVDEGILNQGYISNKDDFNSLVKEYKFEHPAFKTFNSFIYSADYHDNFFGIPIGYMNSLPYYPFPNVLYWENVKPIPVFDIKTNQEEVELVDVIFAKTGDSYNHYALNETDTNIYEGCDCKFRFIFDWSCIRNPIINYYDAGKTFYIETSFELITEMPLDGSNFPVGIAKSTKVNLMCDGEKIDGSDFMQETARSSLFINRDINSLFSGLLYVLFMKERFEPLTMFKNTKFKAIIYRKYTLLESNLHRIDYYGTSTDASFCQNTDSHIKYKALPAVYGVGLYKVELYGWVNGNKIKLKDNPCYIKIYSPLFVFQLPHYFFCDKDEMFNTINDYWNSVVKVYGGLQKNDNSDKSVYLNSLIQFNEEIGIGGYSCLALSTDLSIQCTRNFITANDYSDKLLMSIDCFPVQINKPTDNIIQKCISGNCAENGYILYWKSSSLLGNPLSDAQNLFDRRWFLWDTKGNYKEIEVPKDEDGNHFERLNGLVLI